MKILKLHHPLSDELKRANEVCIASAIVSDAGLDFLLESIPAHCKTKLLIGIDLPTPDSVFRRLLDNTNENIEAKVFTKKGFFHPKLYLVSGDTATVFIGSGNFTDGGLRENIELFHKATHDGIYDDYRKWFDQYFKLGTELSQTWLDAYAEFYTERCERDAHDRRSIIDFKKSQSGTKSNTDLRTIDFTNQFFKLQHYQAFEGNKPNSRTKEANQERYVVKERLMELHEILYPAIQGKAWDLHPHDMPVHIVSSYIHGEHTSESLGALWLHYGRSQKELDKFKKEYGDNQTSLYHMRMQVLVHANRLSVWLRVGKNNGSIVDRVAFKEKMKDASNQAKFFTLLKSLPPDFFIEINGVDKEVGAFKTADELYQFVRADDYKREYFIIGTEYSPDAKEISQSNIVNTVIGDFEKMLPLYQFIKTTI